MKWTGSKWLAGVAVAGVMAALGAVASAQSSAQSQAAGPDQSLGDYARAVRKDKDKAPPPVKKFDNDNLPHEEKVSVVGATPEQNGERGTEAQSGEQEAAKKAATSDADKQKLWDDWKDKLAKQKDQIDLMTRELDVLQREYRMRAAAMYGDVGNRLRNSAEWDKEDAQYKQQIDEKQKAIDTAKQQLDEMQEDARKAGVPSSMRE